jgi:hypothetical protein
MAGEHILAGLADLTAILLETHEKGKRPGAVGNIATKPPDVTPARGLFLRRSSIGKWAWTARVLLRERY